MFSKDLFLKVTKSQDSVVEGLMKIFQPVVQKQIVISIMFLWEKYFFVGQSRSKIILGI